MKEDLFPFEELKQDSENAAKNALIRKRRMISRDCVLSDEIDQSYFDGAVFDVVFHAYSSILKANLR